VATGRILVVDDEPSVLQFMVRVLEGAGYDVRSAPGPPEALGIVKAGHPLDLVVSDIVMPGMHGTQLMREIERLSPATPVVLTSAYVPERQLPEGVPFVPKPFAPRDLLATVERALRKSAAARGELSRANQASEALRERCAEDRRDAAEVARRARLSVKRAGDRLGELGPRDGQDGGQRRK
jgi:CheY-like chemotaxis protein